MRGCRSRPISLPDDPQALKRIIAAMAQDAVAAQAEIAKLHFQLARYRRAEFGRSSEKLAREAEQLELAIEALESRPGRAARTASPVVAAAIETAAEAQKPARRPLPEHLPREDVTASRTVHLPRLRRRVAPDRRGGHRDARLRAGPVQGDPAHPREAVLPGLRHRGRGAGARSRDCPRPRRRGAVGSYRRLEVRRSSAALSTGRDLRPRRASTWRPRPCPAGSARRRRRCSR